MAFNTNRCIKAARLSLVRWCSRPAHAGHTPEHLSYLLAEKAHPVTPWGVLTGDSLLVNSAGLPDLLGGFAGTAGAKLYQTLYGFYLGLSEDVLVYPGHVTGSACGAATGGRLISTIGYERHFSPFLGFDDYDHFRTFVLEGTPPA